MPRGRDTAHDPRRQVGRESAPKKVHGQDMAGWAEYVGDPKDAAGMDDHTLAYFVDSHAQEAHSIMDKGIGPGRTYHDQGASLVEHYQTMVHDHLGDYAATRLEADRRGMRLNVPDPFDRLDEEGRVVDSDKRTDGWNWREDVVSRSGRPRAGSSREELDAYIESIHIRD